MAWAKIIGGGVITLLFCLGTACLPTRQGFFIYAAEGQSAKLLISQIQITGPPTTLGTSVVNQDFIKIYNPNDFAVDLKGYRLVKRSANGATDTSIKSFTDSVMIAAGGYHTWACSTDGFADSLNADSKTTITLADNNSIAIRSGSMDSGQVIDAVCWGEVNNGLCEGAALPAKLQTMTRTNNLDTDNNAADFGFVQAQNNNEQENNDDDENNQTPVSAGAGANINKTLDQTSASAEVNSRKEKIYISEILSDPQGLDDNPTCWSCGEFIELYNNGDQAVDLQNWQIKIDDRPVYVIKQSITLPPQSYLVFYKKQTGLILKNDKGEVRLFEPASSADKPEGKKAKQLVTYKSAVEDKSYNLILDDKTWHWSKIITPGAANKINYDPVPEFYLPKEINLGDKLILDASDSYDQNNDALSYAWDFGNNYTCADKNPGYTYPEAGNYLISLTLSDGLNTSRKEQKIKVVDNSVIPAQAGIQSVIPSPAKQGEKSLQQEKTTVPASNKITVSGIVVVPPGVYASQYFYLAPMREDDTVEPIAVQIYSYYKDFPALTIGDLVSAQGELSDIQSETRIKIKQAADITILDHDYQVVERPIKADQINEQLQNQLVSVSGQMIKKQGDDYLIDDGTGTAMIRLTDSSKLTKADLPEGKNLQIIGLARLSAGQIKIMPRGPRDIIVLENLAAEPAAAAAENIDASVLGAKVNPISSIPSRNQPATLLQYLLVLATGVIITLLIIILRMKKS